jgi:hypothetical protein
VHSHLCDLSLRVRADPSNEQSGLSEEVCNTSCACEEGQHSWSQPLTTSPLFNLRQSDPPSPLEVDPYLEPESATDSPTLNEEACVILIDSSAETYRLETRPLREADPALVTHLGPCGACSSLHDLKVYLERTDLTEPVRSCGLQSISRGQEEGVRCLRELGFSEPCATIWYFNTLNTRSRCLEVCLAHLRSPYVDEEGALNPCLACDEEESGPIFKRYAGRTRRNSGITSAICRPCDTVSSVSHVYLESTAAPLTSPE